MLVSESDQSLIPLYNKVIPKLNGKFRKAQSFRPLRILTQIFTIQLAFWTTILAFQALLLTIPSAGLRHLPKIPKLQSTSTDFIIYPNVDLLFRLSNYSIKTIFPILNGLAFLSASFLR